MPIHIQAPAHAWHATQLVLSSDMLQLLADMTNMWQLPQAVSQSYRTSWRQVTIIDIEGS